MSEDRKYFYKKTDNAVVLKLPINLPPDFNVDT